MQVLLRKKRPGVPVLMHDSSVSWPADLHTCWYDMLAGLLDPDQSTRLTARQALQMVDQAPLSFEDLNLLVSEAMVALLSKWSGCMGLVQLGL